MRFLKDKFMSVDQCKRRILISVGAFFIFGFFSWRFVNAATLGIEPSSVTINTVGETRSFDIILDTTGVEVDGVDIHYLLYDPAFLIPQALAMTPGALFANTILNVIDPEAGRIDFAQAASGGTRFKGKGTLSSIIFKTLKEGATKLSFSFTLGSTLDTNVASFGSDVLTSVTDGNITIQQPSQGGGGGGGGGGSLAPVISNIKVENKDAKTVIISWSTDIAATGELFYGLAADFSNSKKITVTDRNFSVTLLELAAETKYYFKIKNISGSYETTTDVKNFTTIAETSGPNGVNDGFIQINSSLNQPTIISLLEDGDPLHVKIIWKTPNDDTVGKINLWRSLKICAKGSLIETFGNIKNTEQSYRDTLSGVNEYFYIASAVTVKNEESVRLFQWSSKTKKLSGYLTKFAGKDADCDGLSDNREKLYGSDPSNKDSDGDGYFDGIEAGNSYPPMIRLGARALNAELARRYRGRIIFAPHFYGEAYYVNPENLKAYYLGRPYDALQVIGRQGVGITNANLKRIPEPGTNDKGDLEFQKRVAGKILLQVESYGEGWYVNPLDLKRYYLGTPASALAVMRKLVTGVSNVDLVKFDLQL